MTANNKLTTTSLNMFLHNIQVVVNDKVNKWWEIVTSMMGSNSEATTQWNNIFTTQITELLDEMIDEATQKRIHMLNKIEELLKKSSHLCKNLNVSMPNYGSEGLTLYEEQEYLIEKIKEYEEKVESIKREVAKLNKEEQSLVKSLGQPSRALSVDVLPSSDLILQFKKHIDQLESIKFEREETFLNIKSEIVNLVEELNYEPALDFERMVISLDDSLFIVSDSNMKKIDEFLSALKILATEIKEEILSLREKLKSLWDLLNEDLMVRDEFLKNNTGNNQKTLKALQDEVTRCENVKKANIEVFVTRLRCELKNLWDQCHFTEQERNKFEYFHSDTYSEDLLSIHDLEISKMNAYYETNSTLFKLLEKRTELWNRMVELEEISSMPGRFKNRGGQLLKEEKERNSLLKRLPKIEEQLLFLAETFQLKYKRPFYSWGKTVEEIISESYTARDKDKKLKMSARKQKRDLTITPIKLTVGMTSTSTLNLASHTPQAGVKRKILAPLAPLSSNKKILGERHNNGPRTAPSKLQHGLLVGRSRLSIERTKRIEKCRRVSRRQLVKQLQKENISADYDMFEKELDSKDECRSTIFTSIENENLLAVPLLPLTPNSKSGMSNIPSSTMTNHNTPKFSTAPSLQLHF